MEIKGTFQPGDLVAAQWLHLRPGPLGAAAVGLLALPCLWALWFFLFQPVPESLALTRWLFLAVVALLVVYFAAWLPFRARRDHAKRTAMQKAVRLKVSETGLVGESESGFMKRAWADYARWKEGGGFFLLYLPDDTFQVIPKRFFAGPADVGAFRDMLVARVGAR